MKKQIRTLLRTRKYNKKKLYSHKNLWVFPAKRLIFPQVKTEIFFAAKIKIPVMNGDFKIIRSNMLLIQRSILIKYPS